MDVFRRRKLCATVSAESLGPGIIVMAFRTRSGHNCPLLSGANQDYQEMEERSIDSGEAEEKATRHFFLF
jgi:hypothetical protein